MLVFDPCEIETLPDLFELAEGLPKSEIVYDENLRFNHKYILLVDKYVLETQNVLKTQPCRALTVILTLL